MEKEKFVYRPFNKVFWVIVIFLVVFYGALALILRNCTMQVKETVMLVITLCVAAYYFVYKDRLSKDKEYDKLYYSQVGGFSWWYELPFHLCNINMFLVPLGIILHNRYLQGFAFFIGPVGAMMAILMPSISFNNTSILKPRMRGYYITHFLITFNCLFLAVIGIYDPRYSDILPIMLVGILLSFIIFLFNMYLRKKKIAIKANYFYTIDPEENKVLQFFHKFIPYSYLYLIPVFILFVPYMLLLTFIYQLLSGNR
ncbi:MAG: YwaF family protein [Erysipelotrichaceae bacterium]|nr:YwaF family protein [Erysipelotrichaceae bacterium]